MKKLAIEIDNEVIVNDPEFQFASSSRVQIALKDAVDLQLHN